MSPYSMQSKLGWALSCVVGKGGVVVGELVVGVVLDTPGHTVGECDPLHGKVYRRGPG